VANFVLITSASNKMILDKRPSEYIPELLDQLGDDFYHVMASNMVSEGALDAALEDDFDSFLQARSETLHQYALQLLRLVTGRSGGQPASCGGRRSADQDAVELRGELEAVNTRDDPDRIRPAPLDGVAIQDSRLRATLAPASWNLIRLGG
jgi:hypothetical protein